MCGEKCDLLSAPSQWEDSSFVLAASCTATVAATLNLGLFTSTICGGVAAKHPIAVQLCVCGIISCASLVCHIQHIWRIQESGIFCPIPVPCRTLGLANLFSHCAFVTLMLLEIRLSHRRTLIVLLSVISWCVTAMVSLSAGLHCSPSSAILVFCFYVLHIPLIALLIVNKRSSRRVEPSGVVMLKSSGVRQLVPQVLLLFIGTMPQAVLVAVEALELKPFRSADAWCCLMTSVFAALRPLLDAIFLPELGDAAVGFIGSLCRRKVS